MRNLTSLSISVPTSHHLPLHARPSPSSCHVSAAAAVLSVGTSQHRLDSPTSLMAPTSSPVGCVSGATAPIMQLASSAVSRPLDDQIHLQQVRQQQIHPQQQLHQQQQRQESHVTGSRPRAYSDAGLLQLQLSRGEHPLNGIQPATGLQPGNRNAVYSPKTAIGFNGTFNAATTTTASSSFVSDPPVTQQRKQQMPQLPIIPPLMAPPPAPVSARPLNLTNVTHSVPTSVHHKPPTVSDQTNQQVVHCHLSSIINT